MDTADLSEMGKAAGNVVGWTTNPTLMRRAGVTDYRDFARGALALAGDRPVSFEVFADDFAGMHAQALEIASWGDNAYVKVPVTNTQGQLSVELVSALSGAGVRLNVTAVFTARQTSHVASALSRGTGPAIVSVFAGRIADTGLDPVEVVRNCRTLLRNRCPRAEMLWASPRQTRDLVLAEEAGCEIITMTPDLIAKLALLGKDLEEYSQETVAMFYRDARDAGYKL